MVCYGQFVTLIGRSSLQVDLVNFLYVRDLFTFISVFILPDSKVSARFPDVNFRILLVNLVLRRSRLLEAWLALLKPTGFHGI